MQLESLQVINIVRALSTKLITFCPGAMSLWQSSTSLGQFERTVIAVVLKRLSIT